jgi:hypothetical protein
MTGYIFGSSFDVYGSRIHSLLIVLCERLPVSIVFFVVVDCDCVGVKVCFTTVIT